MMRDRHTTTVGVFSLPSLLVFIFVLASLGTWAQEAAHDTGLVELTKNDLFSLPHWEKRTIAVDGFTLGISRIDAFRIAEAANLRLVSPKPETPRKPFGPCLQESCSVYAKNWVGIDLYFDAAQRVNKIAVGTSVDEDPEVKKDSVIQFFTGRTAQFFNDYTDAFREQLLGRTEAKVTHEGARFAHVEYDYPQSGVIVNVTLADADPKPLDIELDFVARQ
jgi:hypothetical protein